MSSASADQWLKHTVNQIETTINTVNGQLDAPTGQCSTEENINSIEDEQNKWNEAGFISTEISFLKQHEIYPTLPEEKFTHSINLNLVQFINNGWTKEQVVSTIQRTADIYAQCGIKVNQVKFIQTTAVEDQVDISFQKDEDARLASMAPTTERPLVFYIRSNIEDENAFAWPRRMAPLPRRNTAFITSQVNNSQYQELRDDGYSATAHELAHLYCDCPHEESSTKNLLAGDVEYLSRDLTPAQCQIFKLSPLINKL
ncbi:MAG: hypothetical protein CME62_00275 [Halobacteriovoraceae bacterium]|nr:hypothetical protein [Halobacteriovoraceae bacterium]|tara:strand:+ start:8856 stop:9626 length:771 start_codon:yes stop_codon:yes gene_type:complete